VFLAAGSAQGIAQWILIAIGIGLGVLAVLVVLRILVSNLQEMGLRDFLVKVAGCMGGTVALFTLVGTAMTGQVAESAIAGSIIGAMVLAMALFDPDEA
jgi:hypothetical protein